MTAANSGASPRPGRGTAPLVRINADALRANARMLRDSTPTVRVDALAADAYGHGEQAVRRVLDDVVIDLTATHPEALYGLVEGFRPVMQLSGTVLSTKTLRAGEGVSYGYTHRAPADTRVALVSGGYAQGVVRALGNRISVLVGGALRPIVGRVAMDVSVVDIGEASVVRGDGVIFFGDPAVGEPSVRGWATATGLSVGEIVTAVGVRCRRQDAR